jgi:hypothetical protein
MAIDYIKALKAELDATKTKLVACEAKLADCEATQNFQKNGETTMNHSPEQNNNQDSTLDTSS